MNVEFYGNMCVASGDNWSYKQDGDIKVFSQSGKVPSLRVVKTLIKLIASVELESVKRAITHPYGGTGHGGGTMGPIACCAGGDGGTAGNFTFKGIGSAGGGIVEVGL